MHLVLKQPPKKSRSASNQYKYNTLIPAFAQRNLPSQLRPICLLTLIMGVITFTDEYTSPIPPARAFKALILDGDNLIPKLMPQAFKSIQLIEGDGGAGSIKQINFAEGTPFKSVKHRVDEINEETYKYCYTMIEGDALMGKFEKISYEFQLVPSSNGGTISKATSKYYPSGDLVIAEEEIKAGKDKAGEIFKVLEDYLIKNPDAYA